MAIRWKWGHRPGQKLPFFGKGVGPGIVCGVCGACGACVMMATTMLLSGCVVGPDYHPPAPPHVDGYAPTPLKMVTAAAPEVQAGAAQRFEIGRDVPYAWWTRFGSPKLDALVARALRNNPDLAAAQAALRQAQELTAAQRGSFYPNVGAQFVPQRQMLAGNLGGNSPGIQGNGTIIQTCQNTTAPYNCGVIYNMDLSQITVGFVPDVFGGNARQVESLRAQEDIARDQMAATAITLADNVVAAAVREASLRAQVAATQRLIDADAQSWEILRAQFRLGYAMRADVAAQELTLAQARQQLPPLRKQLEQTRDLLRALAGDLPDAAGDAGFDFSSLTLPRDLPLSLPSQLVAQRPDVRAAAAQLHAASAEVGVAIAARLPQFSIDAAVGGIASKIAQMYYTGGPFWIVTGSVAQTLFDGGTLKHQERAAKAALQQAQDQYRGTVITAFQNVADTLHALQADADALRAAADARRAASIARDIARRQYEAGAVSRLALLGSQAAYQQAVVSLVQAQTSRYADTAALFQSLGGGWQNRPPR